MVGIRTHARSGRRRVFIGAVVAALFVIATPIALAQTDGGSGLPDGDFSGVIGLTGGIVDTQPQGKVEFLQDWLGSVDFAVLDGIMDGTWFMAGESAVDGSYGDNGNLMTITGGGPVLGEGEIGGTPGDYELTGDIEFDGSVTIDVGVLQQTAGGAETKSIDQSLTDVVGVCDRIIGRWDYELKQEAQMYNLNEFFRGYFTAWKDGVPPDRSEETEALIGDINAWASASARVEVDGVNAAVGEGLELLDRAQRMQASAPPADDCEDTDEFLTEMTLAAQDAIDAIVGRYPDAVTPALVALALGSGAIGEGSPTPQAADGLHGKMEAAINDTYDGLSTDVNANSDRIVELATSAEMLGMDTMGSAGLSPGDVLIVEGG